MDFTSLRLRAVFSAESGPPAELDWFGAEEDSLVLSPLLMVFENTRGTVSFIVPKDFDLSHLADSLSLSVVVERSDITGFFLRVEKPEAEAERKWGALLHHFRERLGRSARLHPRVTVPEFNLGLQLKGSSETEGKIFDLSQGGMRVVSDLAVSADETIEFKIVIPDTLDWAKFVQGLSGKGRIRNREQRGFSLQFEENLPFRQSIEALLNSISKRHMQRLKYPRYNIYDQEIRGTVEAAAVRLKDISITGTYLLSEKVYSIDSEISLEIGALEKYQGLSTPLHVKGRVVRVAPDGFIISFSYTGEEDRRRLSAWVEEVAGGFRSLARPQEVEPAVKATLSIMYGSDLMFLNEYLYNLSAGGLFIPTPLALEKGDTVRFVIDLSGTSLADKVAQVPRFLAKVVRKTDQGIGVQFLAPDQVRSELEGVLADLMRKEAAAPKKEFAADLAAAESVEAIEQGRALPSMISPRVIAFLAVIGLVVAGLGSFYSKKDEPPPFVEPPMEAAKESTGSSDANESPLPESVQIIDGEFTRTVALADIRDVSYDQGKGIGVVLADGTTVAGAPLVQYLPKELQEKLDKLILQSAESTRTTEYYNASTSIVAPNYPGMGLSGK